MSSRSGPIMCTDGLINLHLFQMTQISRDGPVQIIAVKVPGMETVSHFIGLGWIDGQWS